MQNTENEPLSISTSLFLFSIIPENISASPPSVTFKRKELSDFLHFYTVENNLQQFLTQRKKHNLTAIDWILKGIFFSRMCFFFWRSQRWLIDHSPSSRNPVRILLILHHFKGVLKVFVSRMETPLFICPSDTRGGSVLWLWLTARWCCWKLWATDTRGLPEQMWQLPQAEQIDLAPQVCFEQFHRRCSPDELVAVSSKTAPCHFTSTIKILWVNWEHQMALCVSKVLFCSWISPSRAIFFLSSFSPTCSEEAGTQLFGWSNLLDWVLVSQILD